MATNFSKEAKVIDFAPAADVLSGALVGVGPIMGVAIDDIATGALGPVMIAGQFSLPKLVTDVVAVGDALNFDQSTGEVTVVAVATAGDITGAAVAVGAAGNGATTVEAVLTGVGVGVLS